MPILYVEAVGDVGIGNPAQAIADEAGKIFKSPPGETWVKFNNLTQDCYAENDVDTVDVRPVFVSVLLGRCHEGLEARETASALSRALAKVLLRPEANIHILFEASALGRIAFGGKLQG